MHRPDIAVIIPAYNEEDNIARVVEVYTRMKEFSEVIVVDDGSHDHTAQHARKAGARVITQRNQGKGVAMKIGVQATKAPIIFFSDADLLGLTPPHVRSLLGPVVHGKAVMTVGLRDRGRFLTRVLPYIGPVLGGERAMKREVFEALSGVATQDFGIETIMNAYCAKKRLPVKYIPMWGVTQIIKEKKYGFWRGFTARVRMGIQIIRAELAARHIK